MTRSRAVRLPLPELQVDFSACLAAARGAYLVDSLSAVVGKLDTARLDTQLAGFVPRTSMRSLASTGLRAELGFLVPMVLEANPRLLSYYRLLLGHSQKAFYDGSNGTTRYRCMEDGGTLPSPAALRPLCRALIAGLNMLVESIGAARITRDLLDDLTLLTLGPQLRGAANVKKGYASIQAVFEIIHAIVRPSVTTASDKRLVLKNAAGRRVVIQFAADPDIVIQESIGKDSYRNVIAIEVKGGTDFSNIHNRIGEAEKSHQKARQAGYVECWTIVNVHKMNPNTAAKESPSTNRFFQMSAIIRPQTADYADFRNRIVALTGLADFKPD